MIVDSDKEYYAKYIIVPGEITDNDYIIDTDNHIWKPGTLFLDSISPTAQKVKLFLCTKKIPREQLGNLVYHNKLGWGKLYSWALSNNLHIQFDSRFDYYETSGWNFSNVDFAKGETSFVIGEISSDANWINEGDEFNREDIKLMSDIKTFEDSDSELTSNKKSWEDKDKKIIVLIKGKCGKFH